MLDRAVESGGMGVGGYEAGIVGKGMNARLGGLGMNGMDR